MLPYGWLERVPFGPRRAAFQRDGARLFQLPDYRSFVLTYHDLAHFLTVIA